MQPKEKGKEEEKGKEKEKEKEKKEKEGEGEGDGAGGEYLVLTNEVCRVKLKGWTNLALGLCTAEASLV